MAKVEGSNPFIRFVGTPVVAGPDDGRWGMSGTVIGSRPAEPDRGPWSLLVAEVLEGATIVVTG
jgi:hypothetical protein